MCSTAVLGHGNNILFAPLLSLYLIFKMKFTFKVLNPPQKMVFVQNFIVLICKHKVTIWRTSYTSFKLFCYAYQVTMSFLFLLFDKICRQKHLTQPLLVIWIRFHNTFWGISSLVTMLGPTSRNVIKLLQHSHFTSYYPFKKLWMK